MPTPGRPRLRTALALVLLLLLATAARAPQAFAHAAFLASKPAPGQRVRHGPSQIRLEFTEPLNRHLSKVTITDLRNEKPVDLKMQGGPSRDLVIRPANELPTAAYRVDWFSVSADDGHAEAGQFSFGVRTAAIGGASQIQQSPLARSGWLRIAIRAVFYAALFFFAGGLFNAALLSDRRGRAQWLIPKDSQLQGAAIDPRSKSAEAWRRTIDAGWLAAAGGAALAVAEASDASGSLSLQGLNDYLLTNTAGVARVLTVVTLALAALLARRLPRSAAASCAAALLTLAVSGHANSADPRGLAIVTDWIHLVAAAVWIGGIAQLALSWAGPLLKGALPLRRAVMSGVLERFGRIALPAFLVVLASGLANALIELGRPAELWQSSYGRVLAVKMGLVALVALISYLHAVRLRPRLIAANPHPDWRAERRHWQLLRREPLVGISVLAVAALLVAFPLPPRQLAAAQPIAGAKVCNPCPLATARDDQLAVADHLGPAIVAVWLNRNPAGLRARVRLLGEQLKPVPGPVTITGANPAGCGPGCWDFRVRGHPAFIDVSAPIEGHAYSARLPAEWIPGAGANQRARRLLAEAQDAMNHLHSLREHERITSGPGSLAVTNYRLLAPNRFAYHTKTGADSITVGKRSWDRLGHTLSGSAAHGWRRNRYSGGGPGFTTQSWFRWTPYAESVRLMGLRREHGRRIAELALYDQATPAWWRLRIDLGSLRTPSSDLIAEGHFMTQRYYAFNRALAITPPALAHGG